MTGENPQMENIDEYNSFQKAVRALGFTEEQEVFRKTIMTCLAVTKEDHPEIYAMLHGDDVKIRNLTIKHIDVILNAEENKKDSDWLKKGLEKMKSKEASAKVKNAIAEE
jgi:hypothetical protein